MSSKDTTLPGTEEAYHQFVSLCPQDAKMEGTVDRQTDVEAQLLRFTQVSIFFPQWAPRAPD